MLELPMAPNCGDHAPTVRFESPDHVAHLHFGNVAVGRSAIDVWNLPLAAQRLAFSCRPAFAQAGLNPSCRRRYHAVDDWRRPTSRNALGAAGDCLGGLEVRIRHEDQPSCLVSSAHVDTVPCQGHGNPD